MRKQRRCDPDKEQWWRDLLEQFQKSGLPFKKFCAREKISPNTFQYWRRELRERDAEGGIVTTISKGDNRPSELPEKIDFWTRILEEIERYPGSIRSFCSSRGISSGSLHYWTTRLKKMNLVPRTPKENESDGTDLAFVQARVVDDQAVERDVQNPREQPDSDRIEIRLSDGTVIAAPNALRIDTLIQLVNGLRGEARPLSNCGLV